MKKFLKLWLGSFTLVLLIKTSSPTYNLLELLLLLLLTGSLVLILAFGKSLSKE